MTTRVFVGGDGQRGWRYVLAGAEDVNETYTVGRKRHPTRGAAAMAGEDRARAMGMKIAPRSWPG